ncbi:MAG TPA: hypothetical protein DCM86_02060, partial [Verrucomicrobiales bacterium]|nr:hypothetical protein [Verrucomicrobiales bacterium]
MSLATALTDSYGSSPLLATNGLFAGRSLFENTKGSATFLNLRQPLLRNLWTDQTRLTIRVRRVDLKDSELGFRQSLMTTVFNVEQAYYDLIAARETVKVQEKALELAQRLLEENADKVKIGVMAQLDEKQAQSQVASSQAALITARRTFSADENILKNLMTDNYEAIHALEFT